MGYHRSVIISLDLLPLKEPGQLPPADDQLLSLFSMPFLLDGKMTLLAHAFTRVVTVAAFQWFESCAEDFAQTILEKGAAAPGKDLHGEIFLVAFECGGQDAKS